MIKETIKRVLFLVFIYIVSEVILIITGGITMIATNCNYTIVRIVGIFVSILVLYCLLKIHNPKFGFIKEKLFLKKILIAIGIGGIAFGIGLVFHLIFYPHNINRGTASFSKLFFVTIICVPIIEELIFRYWIFSYLDKYHINKWCILLTSTILFYLSHIRPSFSEDINWRFDVIVGGTLFFLLYEKNRDVRYSMIAHVVLNALGSLLEWKYLLYFL